MRTGKPIVYTSADSVLQIAAHEKTFGLENLYKLCEIAYKLVQPYHIARVIARPFVGEKAGEFTRTGNRHDYAVPAPEKTLLDEVYEKAGGVYAVGKSPISSLTGVLPGPGMPPVWMRFSMPHWRPWGCRGREPDFHQLCGFRFHLRPPAGCQRLRGRAHDHRPETAGTGGPAPARRSGAGHRGSWLRSHLEGNGSYPGTRAHAVLRPGVRPGALQPMDTYGDGGQILARHLGLELTRGKAQEVY